MGEFLNLSGNKGRFTPFVGMMGRRTKHAGDLYRSAEPGSSALLLSESNRFSLLGFLQSYLKPSPRRDPSYLSPPMAVGAGADACIFSSGVE